ncbi:hypothetical protein VKT23_002868 [Stygiomarasmius scandens]|uniref:AB hydrolase-1 domain-containing protein n=1 Tax=Marasmiellus scandens TaxID=2682957 RepID=A0ABR1JXA1_9AGAR
MMTERAHQAPLNYSNPDVGTTAIAIVKLSATMENASEYGGPVFMNPGGPGLSGVEFVMGAAGKLLHELVGKQFDLIGFDPRGVGFSTPSVTVLQSNAELLTFFTQEPADLNSTSEALPEAWARWQVFGQAAQARDNGILNFVSTGNAARDMLGMTEALGQEKLQYYGGSYGTALGAAFATMFPDRVGRMVLDGCVDMDGYFGSDFYASTGLLDADKAMQTFFDGCHAAGPEACPFYASSPSEIAANLEAIYTSLRSQPVPVFTGDSFSVITYDLLRGVVFTAITAPYSLFQILASGLAELSSGNGTESFGRLSSFADPSELRSAEATSAIACSDADPFSATATELRETMASINSSFSGIFAMHARTRCSGWRVHPDDRFRGPVGANTSSPLLMIGNTADPRTPLVTTKKTSSMFPGSAVLVQDSPGPLSEGLTVPYNMSGLISLLESYRQKELCAKSTNHCFLGPTE